jgi:hypothetical protein
LTGFWVGRGYLTRDMKCLSLLVAILAFLLGACERHNWEDVDEDGDGTIDQNEKGTKRLYKEHEKHKGGDKDGEKH